MFFRYLMCFTTIFALLVSLSMSALANENAAAVEARTLPDAEDAAKESAEDDEWEDDDWDDEAGEYDVEVADEDKYSLEKCIELALKQNYAIKAANWEVQYYDAKANEAWWAWFPKITIKSVLTAAPDYDPPPLSNASAFLQYQQDWYKFDGILWGNDVDLTQMLYTFGKISSYRSMGKLGRQASHHGKKAVENKIIYEVKRAYFSLQLVERTLDVLDEGMSYVNSAEKKLNELLKSGSESVTEIDQYKFKVVRADLLSRMEEAKKNQYLLIHALKALLNLHDDAKFYLARRYPKNPLKNEELSDSKNMLETMKTGKPEYKLLDVKFQLEEEKLKLQKAWYFPDFFLYLKYKYVTSPEMPNINSPFLNDPYNTHYFAFFVGLNYTFDLPLQMNRVKQAEARVNKVDNEAKFHKAKMKLELEEAFASYNEKYQQLQINSEGQEAGRKWMITALMSYNIGLMESSSMVEAIAAYFKTEFNYYSAMHSVLCAEAKLKYQMGNEADTYAVIKYKDQ